MFLGMYFFGHRSLLSNRHTAMSIIKELVTDLNPVGICELEFTLAFKAPEKIRKEMLDKRKGLCYNNIAF